MQNNTFQLPARGFSQIRSSAPGKKTVRARERAGARGKFFEKNYTASFILLSGNCIGWYGRHKLPKKVTTYAHFYLSSNFNIFVILFFDQISDGELHFFTWLFFVEYKLTFAHSIATCFAKMFGCFLTQSWK